MNRPIIDVLPYRSDSAALFERISDRPWAIFLDSGRPVIAQGRYDILSFDPWVRLVTRGALTEVISRSGSFVSPDDPFDLLRHRLGPKVDSALDIPFCGGAMGGFSYDLGRRLERLPKCAEDDEGLPQMTVGIYDWAAVVDHECRRSWLVGQGRDAETQRRWKALRELFGPSAPGARVNAPSVRFDGPVRPSMTREQYARACARIMSYIAAGDCYQVNLAQRFSVGVDGDPWCVYRMLREINPAPFSAYFNAPDFQVLSSSPERFLSIRNGRVLSQPIKGTAARDPDPELDARRARALLESPKNRAENLMIVDLLRNDLGKNCATGSVEVPKLFEVQSFATVHHLVSSITGRLAAGRDGLDLLRGCFPGGSITGAPKVRAMEVIEELEPHRRGMYCGAMGYVSYDGSMDTSIAIRTLVKTRAGLSFWAGGGIVADSCCSDEYRETLDKAAAIFRLIQSATPNP